MAALCIPANEGEPIAKMWTGPENFSKTTPLARIGWGFRFNTNARARAAPTWYAQSRRGYIITRDKNAIPLGGDSGGALFAPDAAGNTMLIGIHSTWEDGVNPTHPRPDPIEESFDVSVAPLAGWLESIRCPDAGADPAPFTVSRK